MSDVVITTRQQQRRDTSQNWVSANPVLLEGEIGVELDEKRFKIGDGTSDWGNLPYFSDTSKCVTVGEPGNEFPAVKIMADDSKLFGGRPTSDFSSANHSHTPESISALPITGGAMTGQLSAKDNINYSTAQVRNIVLLPQGSALEGVGNGGIIMVYK